MTNKMGAGLFSPYTSQVKRGVGYGRSTQYSGQEQLDSSLTYCTATGFSKTMQLFCDWRRRIIAGFFYFPCDATWPGRAGRFGHGQADRLGKGGVGQEAEDWSKNRRELGQVVCGLGQEEPAVGPLGAEGPL
jgi:hypothetical protein